MGYFVALYKATSDERNYVFMRVLHKNLTEEQAEKRTCILNLNLGFKLDSIGSFTTEPGDLFAMCDDMEMLICSECKKEFDDPEFLYQVGHCIDCDDALLQENG